jgi:alcohol dehydrogenase
MEPFNFCLPTGVVFGPGSVARLPEAVSGLGSKALLVTYPDVMRATGILGMVTDLLGKAGVAVVVDESVEPNPRAEYVDRLATVVRDEDCSFVVGLGGGSAMDAAKAIAFSAANDTSVLDYLPGGKNPWAVGVRDALPIVTITTTAGTGSEVTRIAVITDTQRHYKPGVVHRSLYPTVSIVDPNLMLGVPGDVTATTGVDVLFHALEAFLSRGANLFSDLVGQEAIRLTVANLETVFHDGSNLGARTNMAWASTLAGLAFDNANVVAIHAIGQCIGGHTDSVHGKTMAALGPAYLGYTYASNPARYAKIAQLLGRSGKGLTETELAEQSSEALKDFLAKVDLDISASSLGVTEDMIQTIAQEAFLTMKPCMDSSLANLDEEDAAEILRRSM